MYVSKVGPYVLYFQSLLYSASCVFRICMHTYMKDFGNSKYMSYSLYVYALMYRKAFEKCMDPKWIHFFLEVG